MAKKYKAVPPKVSIPTLKVEEVVAVRRALANYLGIMDRGELEGQRRDFDPPWSKAYVRAEMRRCEKLLEGAFAVAWEWVEVTTEGTDGKERSLD
jgi:hypothetical protein